MVRKLPIRYVPHGINEKVFHPIKDEKEVEELKAFKQKNLGEKNYKFIAFWNSRNIRRKQPGDIILAWSIFCKLIEEDPKKCLLIMHTQAVDNNGTDLIAVRDVFCDFPETVLFSQNKLTSKELNFLYNLADVTLAASSNEGWGLSLTESLMAGTPILANVTGGMQDQMRFEDEEGNWLNLSPEYPSNAYKKFQNCGEWAFPVFPTNRSLVGSPKTPYIYDDRCSPVDFAETLNHVYNIGREELEKRGESGRKWVVSEESQMSAQNMADNVIDSCEKAFEFFIPRESYELIKVTSRTKRKIKQALYVK